MSASERHSIEGRFGLGQLIDLEVQLASDRQRPVNELVERDRAIGLRFQPAPQSRIELVSRWVEALRGGDDQPSVGDRVERAHVLSNGLVVSIFFLIGVTVALAVLQFTGDHPINVLVVLGVFVFLQLLNLIGTVVAFIWSRFSPGFFERFPLVALVKKLIARLVGPEDAGQIMARRSLYGGVERWVLFKSMQIGALAFNLGALLTLFMVVTFTDLAFAWSTTLQVGASGLHRFCEILAWPWHAWVPEAIPSEELVRSTRYFRLEGTYVNAPSGLRVQEAALAGGWWPFLLMSMLVYGLLPRLLLYILSTIGLHKAFGNLPFDTPDVEEVIARLTTPRVRSVHQNDPGNVAPLGDGHQPLGRLERFGQDGPAIAVRWRDAEISEAWLSSRLKEKFGATFDKLISNAGGHDYSEDEALLRRLEENNQSVVFVAEPWNAPDRAFKRFVRLLRERGDAKRKIYVLLTQDGDPEQREVWAGYLAELGDPYIALDAT